MSFEHNCEVIKEQLGAIQVIPVLALETVADGLRMAEILDHCGLRAAEITFRTEAAEEVIREVSQQFPNLCVGAGTVLNDQDLHRAIQAGARFAVAPGFNPVIVQDAIANEFPFFPGVASPTDAEQAMALGCRMLKFFPAEAAGGVPMLKSIVGPYRHLGVQFMPTGGITSDNMMDYLSIPEVVAVGGTWLGKPDHIAAEKWDDIEQAVTAVVNALASD